MKEKKPQPIKNDSPERITEVFLLNLKILRIFVKPGYHLNSVAYQHLRGMRNNVIQYVQMGKQGMEKHTGGEQIPGKAN